MKPSLQGGAQVVAASAGPCNPRNSLAVTTLARLIVKSKPRGAMKRRGFFSAILGLACIPFAAKVCNSPDGFIDADKIHFVRNGWLIVGGYELTAVATCPTCGRRHD